MSADYGRRSTDLTVAPVVPVWEVCIAGQPERVLPVEWSWLRARAAYLWLRYLASRSSAEAVSASSPDASTCPATELARQPYLTTSPLASPHAGTTCAKDRQLTYEGGV